MRFERAGDLDLDEPKFIRGRALMSSFQISITPSRRAAARYIASVRKELLEALAEESAASGMSQSDIARAIGVHRSIINRELRGQKDLTLGRVAELAWAMGRKASFALPKQVSAPRAAPKGADAATESSTDVGQPAAPSSGSSSKRTSAD
jgi:plasmid maintenance system antidote protein VapI